MKTLLLVIALITNFACAANIDITFLWDKNPEVDVYDYILKIGKSPGVYDVLNQTVKNANRFTVSLPEGIPVVVVVCAVNSSEVVSPPSDEKWFQIQKQGEIKIPSKPAGLAKPKNLQVRLEFSTDLKIWQTACVKQSQNVPQTFWRAVMEGLN